MIYLPSSIAASGDDSRMGGCPTLARAPLGAALSNESPSFNLRRAGALRLPHRLRFPDPSLEDLRGLRRPLSAAFDLRTEEMKTPERRAMTC